MHLAKPRCSKQRMHVIQEEMLQLSHAFSFLTKGSHCYENINKLLGKILVKNN